MHDEYEPGDPAPWPLPSFIRCTAAPNQFTGLPFDCWCPAVTGRPPLDYETGRRYGAAALDVAREYGGPILLINILEAMSHYPLGMVERAFLAMLAERAAVGGVPPGLTDQMALVFVTLSSVSMSDIAVAEDVTGGQLEAARLTGDVTPIMDILYAFMARDLGPCAGIFLYKVCQAAMNGAGH
jgi:hypothetical protein